MVQHNQEPTFDIVIPMEDDLLHTAEHPFCWQDPACPCHEDPDSIRPIEQAFEDGLLTSEEANRTIAGWYL